MYVSQKAEQAIGQKYRTIFPVKDDNGNSYMIDGWVLEKDRVDVFYDEHEYNAIHQELLQRREEVAELNKQLEQIKKEATKSEWRYKQAVDELDILRRKIDELFRERKELLATIERAVDERRVVLPSKAAKALKILLDQFGSDGTLELILGCRINSVMDAVSVHDRAWYKEKVEIVKEVNFDLILEAIVNGFYSHEEKLEEKVSHMLHEWLEAEYEGDEETDRREFAKRLVSFMRGELTQSG